MLDRDFRELLACFIARKVEFLLVGGYAVAIHGHPRFTGDLDLWIRSTGDNAAAVLAALEDFGLGSLGLSGHDLQSPDMVIQIGYPPVRVDILTSIDGVVFSEAYERRLAVDIDGLLLPVISLADLRINKAASGRHQDLADLEALEGKSDHR